jgi:hypothetical protein
MTDQSARQRSALQFQRAEPRRYAARIAGNVPGTLAAHASGRAHHSSFATAKSASAPAQWLPSAATKRTARNNSCLESPSNKLTRGSCNAATANPRRRIGPARNRAIRVQNAHSASKKSQPRACFPFRSVISDASEIIVPSLVCRFCFAEHQVQFSAQPGDPFQPGWRQAYKLFKQSRGRGQEFEHLFESLARVRAGGTGTLQFANALFKHAQRRVNLAPLPLFGNNPKYFPDVLQRFEVIAAISESVHYAYDSPTLELAKAGADV